MPTPTTAHPLKRIAIDNSRGVRLPQALSVDPIRSFRKSCLKRSLGRIDAVAAQALRQTNALLYAID